MAWSQWNVSSQSCAISWMTLQFRRMPMFDYLQNKNSSQLTFSTLALKTEKKIRRSLINYVDIKNLITQSRQITRSPQMGKILHVTSKQYDDTSNNAHTEMCDINVQCYTQMLCEHIIL